MSTQHSENSAERPTLERREFVVLPLRDMVVFPHMVVQLFIGRQTSVRALEQAMKSDKQILLAVQKSPETDAPGADEIASVGAVAGVLQILRLPDGTLKVLVEGRRRATIQRLEHRNGLWVALAELHSPRPQRSREEAILVGAVLKQFEQYLKLSRNPPAEVLASLAEIDDPDRFSDAVAAQLKLKISDKQALLALVDPGARLERLAALLEGEIDILLVEKRVQGRVKKQMARSQREYYLNEQIKAIKKELGENEESKKEFDDLVEKIAKAGMPKEARAKAEAELKKLKRMSPMSAEATVVRNYLDALIAVPWKKGTRIRSDLAHAEAILEEDHYGLERVKERILEYLAVQKRVGKMKGAILCLVGAPGVGKTSLGASIARATHRKFVRMALGGVRDEAEIRGHRRTYIGSMPGKIIHNMTKAGVKNPLFLLDEIDKMSMDFRGDPSSALLEVLDPEQNHTFNDHYLEVDYSLSNVMFVATSNTLNIPAPLLDRMEIIRIAGYTEEEKVAIARRYLIPKQLKNSGLKAEEIALGDAALRAVIRYYTREAGVRNLEREIARIFRKAVKRLALKKATGRRISVTVRTLEKYLGVRRYRYGLAEENDRVGQVTGLAWTEMGGDLLTIEAAVMSGKGKQAVTGQLGDVMKESIEAAMTVVRGRAESLGIPADFYQTNDVHIHVPEGAIPKDGPSAGVAMCVALVSALTGIPACAHVAMTGEITLRGEVLPIGGLKEKFLAAHRGGIRTVLIPEENRKDLKEIPDHALQGVEVKVVRWIDEVWALALRERPVPRPPVVTATDDEAPILTPPLATDAPGDELRLAQ